MVPTIMKRTRSSCTFNAKVLENLVMKAAIGINGHDMDIVCALYGEFSTFSMQ